MRFTIPTLHSDSCSLSSLVSGKGEPQEPLNPRPAQQVSSHLRFSFHFNLPWKQIEILKRIFVLERA